MSKKFFTIPLVGLSPIDPGGDVTDPGHGTGQSGPMMTYDEWLESGLQLTDYDFDGDLGTFDDYGTWWATNFGYQAWIDFGNDPDDWNPDWED